MCLRYIFLLSLCFIYFFDKIFFRPKLNLLPVPTPSLPLAVHPVNDSTGERRTISTQTPGTPERAGRPTDLDEGTFCISFAFSVAIIGTLNVNSARLNRHTN